MAAATHTLEFTDAFRQELTARFGLSEDFVRAFLAGRKTGARQIDRWEDLVDPGAPFSSAYIHFALSSVVRGRQARDLILRETGISSGRSLDVGSAYGGMVVAFAEKGFDATGVEIDEHWCRLGNINCSSRGFGERISLQDFLASGFDGSFDVITCNDVIEHVVEPRRALAKMSGLLREGGALYLVIPNARSWDHVLRDGHYAEFGLNLLDHHAAREYYELRCRNRFGKAYSCGEFYPLEWYRSVLGEQGLACRVLRPNAARLPSREDLDSMIGKLDERRRAWRPDGLPEILAERLMINFDAYIAEFRRAYEAASSPEAILAFCERFMDPFWTVIAR